MGRADTDADLGAATIVEAAAVAGGLEHEGELDINTHFSSSIMEESPVSPLVFQAGGRDVQRAILTNYVP